MPIPCPHFKITIVKRSQGQSAVAGAAYQSGERLFSEYDQKTKFYNKKKELVHAEIMLPSHAPPGYADRATLWNAVEAVENQWNSQLARRIVLAFPVEVPKEQYLSMIKEFCQEQFVSKGMIADFAIHDKGDAHIAGLKADAQLAAAHPQGKEEFCGMVIKGVTYDEKKTAGERLVLACSELPNAEEKVIGSYRGFELSLRFDTFRSEYQALLKGQRKYTIPLGTDPLGNIIRLDNSLNNFPERINSAENELATLHQQQAAAQIEVEKPFPQEEELAEKSARLAELNAQLDVDEKNHEPEQDEEEQEDTPRRPSVLAALEEKTNKPEPVKPFRSYYDKDGDAR